MQMLNARGGARRRVDAETQTDPAEMEVQTEPEPGRGSNSEVDLEVLKQLEKQILENRSLSIPQFPDCFMGTKSNHNRLVVSVVFLDGFLYVRWLTPVQATRSLTPTSVSWQ